MDRVKFPRMRDWLWLNFKHSWVIVLNGVLTSEGDCDRTDGIGDFIMEEEIIETCGSAEFREQLDRRRRLPNQPKKSYEPTQLWDRYQEIARRILLGQKNVQIANDMDLAPETVSYIRNSDIVKAQLEKLQARADESTVDITSRIKSLAPKALDVLEAMIKGEVDGETIPPRLRAFHAEKLLDRAGHAPPKEVRSLNLHGHYTSEDIERIKERATAAAAQSSQMIVVDDPEEGQISYG